jgi:hypothetical protein
LIVVPTKINLPSAPSSLTKLVLLQAGIALH